MIVYKCPNCAGEMSIDGSGAMFCEFCGSKLNFSDRELDGYRTFRKQMLTYLRNLHDRHSDGTAERLWDMAEQEEFISDSGTPISVSYIFKSTDGHSTIYVARSNVLYYYPAGYKHEADKMESGLRLIRYPAADIKGLSRCFPNITGRYTLADGAVLISASRDDTVFPLSMYGALPAEHVAWIISRLENIACVLEYSNITHNAINIDNVFINPLTHEAVLYGGWSQAKSGISYNPNMDLSAVRATARKQLGVNASSIPVQMDAFLNEKPCRNAYDDFSAWDRVIVDGFGGHSFKKMNVDDNMTF